MGNEGFLTFALEGWAFGILFITKPRGPPRFESFYSLNIFWSIFVFGLHLITITLSLINIKILDSLIKDDKIVTYITRGIFACYFLSALGMRIILIRHAKSIAKVLSRIYNYKGAENNTRNNFMWRRLRLIKALKVLIALSNAIICSVFFGRAFRESIELGKWIGEGFYILSFFHFYMFDIIGNVAYFLVSVTVMHMAIILEDFCISIGAEAQSLNAFRDNYTNTNYRDSGSLVKRKNKAEEKFMTEYFLKKFDDIEELFETAKFLKPLTFFLVSEAVLQLIPSCYSFITLEGANNDTVFLKLTMGLMIARSLSIFVILAIGDFVKQMVH